METTFVNVVFTWYIHVLDIPLLQYNYIHYLYNAFRTCQETMQLNALTCHVIWVHNRLWYGRDC